jgi:hypothetical protein
MHPNKIACGQECKCKGKTIKERFELYGGKLKEFLKANEKTRRNILANADPCLVRLICEIGLNILKGNIKLPDNQYQELKPHKRMLLSICKSGLTFKQRRSILVKHIGGFLPKVLPLVLPAVSSYIGHTLANG